MNSARAETYNDKLGVADDQDHPVCPQRHLEDSLQRNDEIVTTGLKERVTFAVRRLRSDENGQGLTFRTLRSL